MADVPRNTNGSYTLYDDKKGITVILTFPKDSAPPPPAGFKVVTKKVPSKGLPDNYTWLFNFGIQNKAGKFVKSVGYKLQGTALLDKKSWVIYYGNDSDPRKNVHAMNGKHTTPGDPPVGIG